MSGEKIVALPGNALSAHQTGGAVNLKTVERLERLLARAKSGELQVVAYTGVSNSGDTINGWTTGSTADVMMMVGGLAVLKTDMALSLLKQQEIE